MNTHRKKPHSHFSPTNMGAFFLSENQVTFKVEKVFFFTVIFATVGFVTTASQH